MQGDPTLRNVMLQIMMSKIYVLSSFRRCLVFYDDDRQSVVDVMEAGCFGGDSDCSEKVLDPICMLCRIRCCDVLRFGD